MVEEKFKNSKNNTIDLKYDKEKYSIEYIKNKKIILLRRLADNQVLEIFSDEIGFIVQYDNEETTNFLVTDYSEKNVNGSRKIQLKHFTDEGYLDHLELKISFNCDTSVLQDCRVTDSSYLVEQSGYSSCIYNLERKSKRFKEVYNDEDIKSLFSDNTLLVSEKVSAFLHNEVNDTIIYGINPETFKITTPIWSELQQRYIDIYTDIQIGELRERLFKKRMVLNREDPAEITIAFEVQEPLNEIAKHLCGEKKSVYADSIRTKANEEFVKSFIKK